MVQSNIRRRNQKFKSIKSLRKALRITTPIVNIEFEELSQSHSDDSIESNTDDDSDYETNISDSNSENSSNSEPVLDDDIEVNSEDDHSDNDSDVAPVKHVRGKCAFITTPLSKSILTELKSFQLQNYLRTDMGGKKDAKGVKQISSHISCFLAWTICIFLPNIVRYINLNVLEKLHYMFTKKSQSIMPFLLHLERKGCKPSTCHNYVNSFTHGMDWMIANHLQTFPKGISTLQFAHVIKTARRKYKKADSIRKLELSDIDELIELGLWTKNGLIDIQFAVHQHMPFAEALVIRYYI